MATYIDNIVKFHTFSKSPVSKDTTLGGAVNPSGHTVTTSQVRAQDIPAFLNTFQGTKEQALTWLGTNYPTPAHNDIVFYGGEFKAGFSTPKCLKWNAKLETPAWEDFDITAAATLKNADDKDVIAVHQNCTTVFVDGTNNAATNSNRNSLFVKKADGSILDHFVASTDKIVAGMPSLGYNALVLWNGAAIDEGELDANYIGNTFAGIVHLNKQYSTGDDAKFKVTCFEYIGEKLTTSLSSIVTDIEAINTQLGNGSTGTDSIGNRLTATETAIKTLTGNSTVNATESIATTAANAINAATLDSSDTIADTEDTSKLVTAEQVKTYVTNNAQVTVKVDETEQATTNLELAGSTGDDVTVTATADTADGYKVTFSATIDKATVQDGVIDATTGNGDKVISATAAKAVAEKAIETALADTADGSLGATIASKVADVQVNNVSVVDSDKVVKLTTTGTDAITANNESTSTKLATEASVAKAAHSLTAAIDAIAGVGVSYEVLGDNEKHESVTAPVKGRIYLEKDENAADGTYIEWFYTGTDWEKIGSTKADHSVYAKTITINKEPKTVSNNSVDLGKAVTSVTAGHGITSGTVSDTGVLQLTLDEASTTQKGIVELASTHEAADTTKAATGATVAAAISGIASTSQSDNGVTVTTAAGSVTGVEVVTTSLVSEGALVESVTGDNLITAADALAAITTATATTNLVTDEGTIIGDVAPEDANKFVTASQIHSAISLAKPENYIISVADGKTDGEGNHTNVTSGQVETLVIKDSRENVYDNDLWGTSVTLDASANTITVDHKYLSNPNASNHTGWLTNVTKVEDNKAYNGDTVVANIQTDMIKDGSRMFYYTALGSFSGDLSGLVNGSEMFSGTIPLGSFSGDLSSLVNGTNMFHNCPNLTSFSGDLSSLVNGVNMFYNTPLESFSSDLSSLVNGTNMFSGANSLTSFSSDLSSLEDGYGMFFNTSLISFTSDLSSLVDGNSMFYGTSLTSFSDDLSSLVVCYNMFANTSLTSFSGDLSSLVDGNSMFYGTSLASFTSDLSSLVDGYGMFGNTSLDVESVELICDVLPNYNTENGGKRLQTATWNESGENKGKYTYNDWESGNYGYPIVKIEAVSDTMSQGNTDGIRRVFGTGFIVESHVKSITIKWKSGSAILGEGYEADRTKIAKIFTDTAKEKGWTFFVNTEIAESGEIAPPNAVMTTDGTIQYYVFAKKDEATEDNATHIDASGKLWKFDTAEAIIGPNIKYWSMFATVEDALTEWELTPWTKPTEEETEA